MSEAEVSTELEITETIPESFHDVALDAFSGLIQQATNAKDFVLEQAPDILTQYINWFIVENIMESSILFLVGITLLIVFTKIGSNIKKYKDEMGNKLSADDNELLSIGSWACKAAGFVIASIFIINSFNNGLQAAKGFAAPKIVLIEAAAHVAKHKQLPNP